MFIRGEKNTPHPWPKTIRGTPRPQRGRGVGGEGAKQPSHNPKTTTPPLLRGFAASRDTKRPPTPQSHSTSVPSVVKKHHSQAILPAQISGWKARATKITKPHPHFSWISCLSWTNHNPMRFIRENPCSSVAKKTPLLRGPKPSRRSQQPTKKAQARPAAVVG